MNIRISSFTSFSSINKVFFNNKNKITETYDDNNVLIKRLEYDEFNRFADCKDFDINGNICSHLHFEYKPDGYIETFKNNESKYTRKCKTFIKDSLKYRVEEFISSNSKSNYIHEDIKDLSGKLLRLTCNGNIIFDLLKK